MTHSLVIGGTGMLSGVVEALLIRGDQVSLIARRPENLRTTRGDCECLKRIAVDYCDLEALESVISSAADMAGKIDLVVAWIHSKSPIAPINVAKSSSLAAGANYFHVLGSSYGGPESQAEQLTKEFCNIDSLNYFQVILGFVLDGKSSRWLTNDEIASGVWRAIQSREARTVIGVIDPWDSRP